MLPSRCETQRRAELLLHEPAGALPGVRLGEGEPGGAAAIALGGIVEQPPDHLGEAEHVRAGERDGAVLAEHADGARVIDVDARQPAGEHLAGISE